MKVKALVFFAMFSITLFGSAVFAADYAKMKTEELAKLRETIKNATPGERKAYEIEWEKRVQKMTEEEKQRYLGEGQGKTTQERERNRERERERETTQQQGAQTRSDTKTGTGGTGVRGGKK